MGVPVLLLLLSLAGVAVALVLPGAGDLILLAGPCAVAALLLVLRALVVRRREAPARNHVLIDGSNVMHWRDNTPQIDTLREVIEHLRGLGLAPGVIFDANAGYLLTGKYRHDGAMARYLGLPEDRVMVVPKGTVADTTLLTVARDFDAPIVTNDPTATGPPTFPRSPRRAASSAAAIATARSGSTGSGLRPRRDGRPPPRAAFTPRRRARTTDGIPTGYRRDAPPVPALLTPGSGTRVAPPVGPARGRPRSPLDHRQCRAARAVASRRSVASRARKWGSMGLFFLGFFWFAGMAVATALPLVLAVRHALMLSFGIAILCLLALQGLHGAAHLPCAPGPCGNLPPLLDHIRLTLATLTVLGLATGLGAGWLIQRRDAPDRG